MMSTTPEALAAYATVASIVVGAVGTAIGLYFNAVNRAHSLEIRTLKGDNVRLEKKVDDNAKESSDSLKAAWLKIDDLRDTAFRKADQKEYRAEVKADMQALGDRLEKVIKDAVEGVKAIYEHRDKGGHE